jgi:hypothetical protein
MKGFYIFLLVALFATAIVFIALYVNSIHSTPNSFNSFQDMPPLVSLPLVTIPMTSLFIDHTYYINLDARTDRRYHVESELKRMGLFAQSTRVAGVLDKFGALGCSKAHLNALELFETSEHTTALIIEDDPLFQTSRNDFDNILTRFQHLHWKWDVILLACVLHKIEPTKADFVLKVLDGQTTAAYIVHKSFLPTLITNVKQGIDLLEKGEKAQHDYCIDIFWKELQPTNQWYTFYPTQVVQRDDFSDIEQRHVHYKSGVNHLETSTLVEYIICVKTCVPRLHQFPEQRTVLNQICKKGNILYFVYYGNPDQKEPIVCENEYVSLQCKDDYLNLCHKFGMMVQFLTSFIGATKRGSLLKGIFFTDDDIKLQEEPFYAFLESHKQFAYWGKTATYPHVSNLSSHIMDKAEQSIAFDGWLQTYYPELLVYEIEVPKVTFCAGGGFFLNVSSLYAVMHADNRFVAFPDSQDLKHHIENDCLKNLHVFDDTEVALALQDAHIFATHVSDLDKIASW